MSEQTKSTLTIRQALLWTVLAEALCEDDGALTLSAWTLRVEYGRRYPELYRGTIGEFRRDLDQVVEAGLIREIYKGIPRYAPVEEDIWCQDVEWPNGAAFPFTSTGESK